MYGTVLWRIIIIQHGSCGVKVKRRIGLPNSMDDLKQSTERVVITVLGKDRVGIVSGISTVLAKNGANILDLTSTKMGDLFIMIMLVDLVGSKLGPSDLHKKLVSEGKRLRVQVTVQHENIFEYMHRV